MKDLTKEIEALQGKINTVGTELRGLLSQIGQAEERKAKAKTDYQAALDAGLEDEMSSCLATIRKMNQEKELLQSQLGDFPAKVADLYAEQRELVKAAREERPKAEAAIRKAEENFRAVSSQIERAGIGLLSRINRLNDTVNKNIKK